MCIITLRTYSGMSPDSSVMLSPSDVSIDPVDGDTVSNVRTTICINIVCVCRIRHSCETARNGKE